MFETKKSSLAVDVPSDLEKVEKELNKKLQINDRNK